MFLPISFTAASSSDWRRQVRKTYAPSATNRFAVARPMPLFPPVTTATLPSSFPLIVNCSLPVLSIVIRGGRLNGFGRPENQRAHLDTLARRRVGRAVWIFERGVRSKSRAAVVLRVVAFQQNRLVRRHPRKVVPAMLRVVEEAEDFAHTVAIDESGRHTVLRGQAASVAERKRRAFDRAANRAPDVEFSEA